MILLQWWWLLLSFLLLCCLFSLKWCWFLEPVESGWTNSRPDLTHVKPDASWNRMNSWWNFFDRSFLYLQTQMCVSPCKTQWIPYISLQRQNNDADKTSLMSCLQLQIANPLINPCCYANSNVFVILGWCCLMKNKHLYSVTATHHSKQFTGVYETSLAPF